MLPRSSLVTVCILAAGLAACKSPQNQAAAPADQTAPPPGQAAAPGNQAAPVTNGDPANGNLASAEQYNSQAQPAPSGDSYNPSDYDQNYSSDQAIQASEPPPPLPDYTQPPAPGDNYIWTPGYWNYANAGYYWVPGAWIVAPYVGALWTPPWWGYDNGDYHWHSGYWAPHIGYYGGIDYGYGYTGRGYYGAYWNNGQLNYNRSVTNVNTASVHNVYNHQVPKSRRNRVSYNGGRGGIEARPTAQELAVVRDPRTPPVGAQVQHMREASSNRAQFAKPGGRAQPAALVASRPLATPYKVPAARPPATAMRAVEKPKQESPARPAPNQRPETQATRVPQTAGPQREVQRSVPAHQPQARPAPQARQELPPRPTPQARQEPRPAVPAPQARATPQARPEARRAPQAVRPAPQARPEAHPSPAPQARREPAPQARPEAHPSPAPQARREARPAPQAARPAPQARPEARPAAPARSEPQHARPESRPAPPPRPAPKSKDEQHKEP